MEELQKVIRHTRETIDDLTAKNDRLAGLAAESADHAASMAEKLLELQKDRDGWKSMSDQWMDEAWQAKQDFKQAHARVEALEKVKQDMETTEDASFSALYELYANLVEENTKLKKEVAVLEVEEELKKESLARVEAVRQHDYTPASVPWRKTCRVCGRDFATTSKGVLRKNQTDTGIKCLGSGQVWKP